MLRYMGLYPVGNRKSLRGMALSDRSIIAQRMAGRMGMAGSPGAIQGPLSHASKTPGRLARKMRMKKWAREVGSPTHPCPGLVFSLFCPQPQPGWYPAVWGALVTEPEQQR